MNGESLEDVFDSSLTLEEDHIKEGFEEGLKDGRVAGFVEGKELGLQKGFEIGQEVGFYAGCAQVWRQLLERQPEAWPKRAERAVAALEQLVSEVPLSNAQDEALQVAVEALRGKFKAALALLGLTDAILPRGDQGSLAF